MSPAQSFGAAVLATGVTWYFQRPLRLVHALRTSAGRGYSCQAVCGVSFDPHSVSMESGAGCHARAAALRLSMMVTITIDFIESLREIRFFRTSAPHPDPACHRRGQMLESRHLHCRESSRPVGRL